MENFIFYLVKFVSIFSLGGQRDRQEFNSDSSRCTLRRSLPAEIKLLAIFLRTKIFVYPVQSHTKSPSVVKLSVGRLLKY